MSLLVRASCPALALLALVACGTSDSEPQPPPARLVPVEPRSEELAQRGVRDDYWTQRFGPYMTPAELRSYWAIDPQDRFEYQSLRLLELSLRERLLEEAGIPLTQRQLDAYAAQPDLDACRSYLAALQEAPEEQ